MSHHHDSGESCPSTSVIFDIIDRKAWTARKIRNNLLRQHCYILAKHFRSPGQITDALRPPLRKLLEALIVRTEIFTTTHPDDFPTITVLVRVAAYHRCWIRRPEDWIASSDCGSTEDRLRSLIRHLFAKWPMPDFFESAWLVRGELIYLERNWYCRVAWGQSLRKLPGMPPSITTRALHLAMGAPSGLTIRQALRWGQVKALGGSDALLAEVLASRMVTDLSNDAIWSRLLEKVIAASHLPPHTFGIISDTLLELVSKDQFAQAELLVGLPIVDLLRYSRSFWRALLNTIRERNYPITREEIDCRKFRHGLHQLNSLSWPALLDAEAYELKGRQGDPIIRIEELTHHYQLVAEGRAMRHCIGSYVRNCKSGGSAIFGLRTYWTNNGKEMLLRHLTIEVSRESRKIIQVRGKFNRYHHPRHVPGLKKWAEKFALQC